MAPRSSKRCDARGTIFQLDVGAHRRHRDAIELNHRLVVATDDEERRRDDTNEKRAREIGTSAARHHGDDLARALRGSHERGAGTCARAEQPDRRRRDCRLPAGPFADGHQSARQQQNVEPQLAGAVIELRFLFGEEIDEQGRQTSPLERSRDELVARAMAAAAAAVRKDHEAGWRRLGGPSEIAVDRAPR